MNEMDIGDLGMPRYSEEADEHSKMKLQIRRFPGQAPAEVKVDGSWTVAHIEQKLAKQVWKANPQSIRLTLNGTPLPKNSAIASLSPQIQGQVLDVVPEHPVGAEITATQPHFSIPYDWYQYTDYSRVQAELQDLPFKPGYGRKFKVTVASRDPRHWLFPVLHLLLRDRWYEYQLVLVGYPEHIRGYFMGALPPCPLHGGKHPHVFPDHTFCWGIERNWTSGMMLFEDFITFAFRTLENPQHHLGCGYY